jgi:hypothetical protein
LKGSGPTAAGLQQRDFIRRLQQQEYSSRTLAAGLQQQKYISRTTAAGLQQEDYSSRATAAGQHQHDYSSRTTRAEVHQQGYSITLLCINRTPSAGLGCTPGLQQQTTVHQQDSMSRARLYTRTTAADYCTSTGLHRQG